ncbi:MAG: hypothetical protein M1829_006084 [Trizodia sp. TS-e1964]|nr:MAG: hypothetical protein M1829_006084 [Trizodia sp. TS-e1964]
MPPTMAPTAEESIAAIKDSLPPNSDYLTYLTIIEYHLCPEILPALHDILQDKDLTANIGWDLIHLLLPLLPDSRSCLEDVARLGNPREVVLKVTECLRKPELEEDHFATLLSVLSILLPRIKTKFPSRFLSTSLVTILSTYSESPTDTRTVDVISFIKTISGKKRPQLPPRKSSINIPTIFGESAPDPEGHSEPPSDEEARIQSRLLQSFITHVIEEYILSFTSEDDMPGLAWSMRFHEKAYPNELNPNKETYQKKFGRNEALQTREETVGQIVALSRDLGLMPKDLLDYMLAPDVLIHHSGEDEVPPPSSPVDIPLSKTGCLYLLAAVVIATFLFDSPAPDLISISFREFVVLTRHNIGRNEIGGMNGIGTEPEAIVDALLAIGRYSFHNDHFTDLKDLDDDEFTVELQKYSLLSSNSPSPSLRLNSHLLTTSLLQAHPSDMVRLSFIRDTLEHCPIENLKESAVWWLRDELMRARQNKDQGVTTVFNTPVAVEVLVPFLYPDLRKTAAGDGDEAWNNFVCNFPFYNTALNFFYFLLCSPLMDFAAICSKHNIKENYFEPLKTMATRFAEAKRDFPKPDMGEVGMQEIQIVETSLQLVEDKLASLNVN